MAQVRKIEWSIEARFNLDNVLTYLETEWTEREVRRFSERLESQLSILQKTPQLYKKSLRKAGLRECQITTHNTLFYTYDEETVYIVIIFDNRQDPEKLENFRKPNLNK